ncbi:uncharacterized protein LOC131425727 [Malaya genurostris]|uniref:uncharacterized protein LOC131425727 n=1 Tax=Malaya genurostris TaxID=325434 RepID=UPI0026F37FBE|nr:uncharacterized protein LOC131425727 [Malaya genurostris]
MCHVFFNKQRKRSAKFVRLYKMVRKYTSSATKKLRAAANKKNLKFLNNIDREKENKNVDVIAKTSTDTSRCPRQSTRNSIPVAVRSKPVVNHTGSKESSRKISECTRKQLESTRKRSVDTRWSKNTNGSYFSVSDEVSKLC